MDSEYVKFGALLSEHAADHVDAGVFDPAHYEFFTNPLRRPRSYWDSDTYTGYVEEWERPSERPTVGNFWVFTLEHDPKELDGFERQLDWLWKKQPDGQTPLEQADSFFRQKYKDYRGYCVVFGGNKSLHIHFIFDTTWLSREAIEDWAEIHQRDPKQTIKSHYKGDISQEAIWPYHRDRWHQAVRDFQTATGIDASFDSVMATLCQKRRFPWGTRVEHKEDNVHGFRKGEAIPQIVLEERIMSTSPKGAEGYFLDAQKANDLKIERAKTRSNRWIKRQTDGDQLALVEAANDHLAIAWGRDYPQIDQIDEIGGIYLRNHENDRNPSSYCGPDQTWIVYRGKDSPEDDVLQHLPGRLNTTQLLEEVLATYEIDYEAVAKVMREPGMEFRGNSWFDLVMHRRLKNAASADLLGAMSSTSMDLTRKQPFSAILSVEGVGKSRGLLSGAHAYRLDDAVGVSDDGLTPCSQPDEHSSGKFFPSSGLTSPELGLHVFASPSYGQAEEQFIRYQDGDQKLDNGSERRGALLKSFQELYKDCFRDPHFDTDSYEVAGGNKHLSSGYSSLVSFVFHEQRPIYDEIRWRARDAVLSLGRSGKMISLLDPNYDIVIFTCKDLAQRLHKASLSLAAIHPEFEYERHVVAGTSGLNDEGLGLTKAFQPYRIIHDEIDLADVVVSASPAEVDFAAKMAARKHQTDLGPKSWSELNTLQQFRAFEENLSSRPEGMGFHRLLNVVEAGFEPADARKVDFQAIPLGVANTDEAAYRKRHGETVYLKQRTWWTESRARVVFLTTETLMADVVAQAGCATPTEEEAGIERRFPNGRWDRDEWFAPDSVPMMQSNQANKANIEDLAANLLNPEEGGFDLVITNMARGEKIVSHVAAKGRNDLSGKSIATVVTYMGEEQYVLLNVVAQMFQIDEPIKKFYRDQINQAMGRNRGQRRTDEAVGQLLVLSPRLFKELGGMNFFGNGRYRFHRYTKPV